MHKRKEDGLVVVYDSVCVGCRYCEMRCPALRRRGFDTGERDA